MHAEIRSACPDPVIEVGVRLSESGRTVSDMDVDLHQLVFGGFDYVYERLRNRVADLDDAEYLWEPVPDMWTIRETGSKWVADWAERDPVPAPVTTIAWRIWHIADCLASYVAPHLGEWPLPGEFRDWCGDAATARSNLEIAHDAFRERITEGGDDLLRTQLGDKWGPYAENSWADLVLHAMDEVAHHGAEVGLLRDLYRSPAARLAAADTGLSDGVQATSQ